MQEFRDTLSDLLVMQVLVTAVIVHQLTTRKE
jgi:hypothetical protein